MDLQDWHILLAGLVTGALAVTAISIAKSKAPLGVKATGIGFCVGVVGYALESISNDAPFLINLLACQTLSFLWPFVALSFGISVSFWLLMLPGVLMTLTFISREIATGDAAIVCSFSQNVVEAGIGLLVLLAVWRSEDDDLDSERRRVRRPFMAVIAVYVIGLALFDFVADEGSQWVPILIFDEVVTAGLAVVGALIFTSPRSALLTAPTIPEPSLERPAQQTAEPEEQLLASLDHEMVANQAWREEGLTVGGLADRLGVPEHRLRPVINQKLGYRNFAAFINSHRLEEVKRRLVDPEHAKETIASIAYECGFGSLGPFGRAFKAETSMTPTAFRNQAKRADSESAPVLKLAASQDEPARHAS
ncbi:MAG: helix-turn-helix domain-containing protein [Pseudomonadota bacterium]